MGEVQCRWKRIGQTQDRRHRIMWMAGFRLSPTPSSLSSSPSMYFSPSSLSSSFSVGEEDLNDRFQRPNLTVVFLAVITSCTRRPLCKRPVNCNDLLAEKLIS